MRNIGALGTLGWIVVSAMACSSEPDPSSGPTGGAASTSGGQVGSGGARPTGGGPTSSGGSATGGATATGGTSTGGVMGSSGKGGGANSGGTSTTGGAKSGTGGALTGTGGAGKGGSAGSAGSGNTAGAAGANAGSGGGASVVEKFSFFVTSLTGMRELAKSQDGFGGDLRFGEKTGLEGADKICRTLAEASMPGAGQKEWNAFLSTKTVNAADRLGDGPWYDRLGRLVAKTKSDLLQERPRGADAAIIEDLPNENGTPNGQDGCNGTNCPDNHDTLTGSKANGTWDGASTCDDWTNTEASGQPRIGHSWSAKSGMSWIQAHTAGGCKAGVQLVQMGGTNGVPTVGAGGGYGGFYCFAKTP